MFISKKIVWGILVSQFFLSVTIDANAAPIGFDRTYSEAWTTGSVFNDGNLNTQALGYNGVFYELYYGRQVQSISALKQELEKTYGKKVKEHKLKGYTVFVMKNSEYAYIKLILIVDQHLKIVGYSYFDWPFIVNKNHKGSPLTQIEALPVDHRVKMYIRNYPHPLYAYLKQEHETIEQYLLSYADLPILGSGKMGKAWFILNEAYYPKVLTPFMQEEAHEAIPKMLKDMKIYYGPDNPKKWKPKDKTDDEDE